MPTKFTLPGERRPRVSLDEYIKHIETCARLWAGTFNAPDMAKWLKTKYIPTIKARNAS